MLSTLLELAGMAAITYATYLVGGLAAGLFAGGGLLLVVGYATEDERAVLALRRATNPARRRLAALRAARQHRRRELART